MTNNNLIKTDKRSGRTFTMTTAENGLNYVKANKADGAEVVLHLASGNTKTGNDHILTYGHSIPESCDHRCECFSEKICYGCSGNYVRYPVNQLYLADNLLYFRTYGADKMAEKIIKEIKKNKIKYFRWFTVGDIPTMEFIRMMVIVGRACPGVKFWGYTKKYMLVNHYIEKYMNGNAEEFLRLTGLIFSHWRNKNGEFFKMLNPYNMPTSEFIPYGMETEAKKADHICPCSNPDVYEHCCNCSNPCYELRIGQSMALLEHSTAETKQRDKEIREAHKAIAEAEKNNH